MQCQKIDAKAMPALGCETLLLFFAARCVLLPLPIYHLAALLAVFRCSLCQCAPAYSRKKLISVLQKNCLKNWRLRNCYTKDRNKRKTEQEKEHLIIYNY